MDVHAACCRGGCAGWVLRWPWAGEGRAWRPQSSRSALEPTLGSGPTQPSGNVCSQAGVGLSEITDAKCSDDRTCYTMSQVLPERPQPRHSLFHKESHCVKNRTQPCPSWQGPIGSAFHWTFPTASARSPAPPLIPALDPLHTRLHTHALRHTHAHTCMHTHVHVCASMLIQTTTHSHHLHPHTQIPTCTHTHSHLISPSRAEPAP